MSSSGPLAKHDGRRNEHLPLDVGSTRDSENTITADDAAELAGQEKNATDSPPDGGYGWVCVACVFWINAHTWGLNSVCRTLPFLGVLNSADLLQVVWCISRPLPGKQYLSRRFVPRVRLCRRPFNLASLAYIANSYIYDSRVWHADYPTHWGLL